ncbi:hypothetical protein N5U14_03310 [Aliarcobacter butzleri]|uniref:hypothetical protein n=1 Tax=Aliarcobacter butzleri TaxID=28197 RepID=UPI0021B4B79C|nr:hypothetical protein [Aliarcobacter butzleri]MCT7609869.1 hypothetical protein [Aliarcobacter butzleri]
MKTCLIESIAKENNFTIIKKLDENNKQYLKEHIQKTILDRYDYNPLEHIQEMINEVIDWFEDELQAINYIQSINYTINDKFYEKLKEDYFDSQDDSICDWEDEFEKPKEDIRLNRYTLTDFIKISFIDGIDLMVEQFEDNYKNHPYLEFYRQGIKENLEIHYKYKNREIETKEYESKEDRIQSLLNFNREPLDFDNIKLRKDLKPLTKREINLVTANIILILNKGLQVVYKENIANNYNINSNTPQTNQELLDNSYDVIINTLNKLANTDDIIDLLKNEKSINSDLFLNAKKLSKVKSDNHYMSFLYKCNSVYAGDELIVFQEFVEALISGYMQFLEFENKEQKIKSYIQDLEVLKRYNTLKENDKNIQELDDKISFLSISKAHQKFIPFKELSNRLEIDTNQISNYITNILNNGTHKNTIKQNFNSLKTISKEICISKF